MGLDSVSLVWLDERSFEMVGTLGTVIMLIALCGNCTLYCHLPKLI